RVALAFLKAGENYDRAYRCAFANERLERLVAVQKPVHIVVWDEAFWAPTPSESRRLTCRRTSRCIGPAVVCRLEWKNCVKQQTTYLISRLNAAHTPGAEWMYL
ncbi:MAG: hypothetical protein AAF671_11040, partial [Pseudomonadota bacterium]